MASLCHSRLGGIHLSFSQFHIMFSICLLYVVFIMWKHVTSLPSYFRTFYHEGTLNLWRLSASSETMWFLSLSIFLCRIILPVIKKQGINTWWMKEIKRKIMTAARYGGVLRKFNVNKRESTVRSRDIWEIPKWAWLWARCKQGEAGD